MLAESTLIFVWRSTIILNPTPRKFGKIAGTSMPDSYRFRISPGTTLMPVVNLNARDFPAKQRHLVVPLRFVCFPLTISNTNSFVICSKSENLAMYLRCTHDQFPH